MKDLKALQKKYEELGAEIERLKQEKDSGTWKPKKGERYYAIYSNGEIVVFTWLDDETDRSNLSIGNVFRTREEVERHLAKLKLIQELKEFAQGFKPDWGNVNEWKYYLAYSYERKVWDWSGGYSMHTQFTLPYFATKERAKEAIKHFGDRLNVLLD